MSTHEEQLPRVEAAVDAAAEQAEKNPTEVAESLQTQLDAVVAQNQNLEVAVEDTVREAGFEYAVDHPEAVAADTATMLENLPKNEGAKTAEMAAAATAMAEKVAAMDPGEAKGMVDKFCQKHFGGSLVEVAKACGDILIPGSDVAKAVMKGELPKGKDLARFASGMVAPPLGTIAFDMLVARGGDTPAEIKQAAIKGRLGADLVHAIGLLLPEVATATTPAAEVMRNVANEVEKTAQKPEVSAADRAKAMGRGLIADKAKLKLLAEGLGVKMTTDGALEAAGITGASAETVKAVGKLIAKDPEKAGRLLDRIFADDGGIVEQPRPFIPGPDNDGGIVAQRPSGLPTGAI